jgi:hypothetical protein
MAIKTKLTNIDDVSVGNNYASAVYLGETLVWPDCNVTSDDGSVAVIRCGNSYVAPAWANSVKAWAVGAGGTPFVGQWSHAGGGGVAYRTYSITPGATINFTVNQFRPGTKDTGGSDTTVIYDGIKIRGFGGGPRSNDLLDRDMLGHSTTYGGRGGVGGTFAGAADGGAAGSPAGMYRPSGIASGAVGRGGNGLDEWNPPEIPAAAPSDCSRVGAANVSGLFEAIAVVGGINTTEICANRAAFGSSAVGYSDADTAFNVSYRPGIGGGGTGVGTVYGSYYSTYQGSITGEGAVVLQFSAASVSNPKPAFTPMAVILTDGAQQGVLANLDGHFSGGISSFQKYTVPAGATTVKAWAVGAGHNVAGGVAYDEWMVYSGQLIYYRIGAANATGAAAPSYVIAGQQWPPKYNPNNPYFVKRLLIGNGGGLFMNVSGAGSYGRYSGGAGGFTSVGGGQTYQVDYGPDGYGPEEYFGGALGENGPLSPGGRYGVGERVKPLNQDMSGLFAAVALAGGSPHFGEGAYANELGNYLAPGLGGGAAGYRAGGQGCVVLKFT